MLKWLVKIIDKLPGKSRFDVPLLKPEVFRRKNGSS